MKFSRKLLKWRKALDLYIVQMLSYLPVIVPIIDGIFITSKLALHFLLLCFYTVYFIRSLKSNKLNGKLDVLKCGTFRNTNVNVRPLLQSRKKNISSYTFQRYN